MLGTEDAFSVICCSGCDASPGLARKKSGKAGGNSRSLSARNAHDSARAAERRFIAGVKLHI